MCKVRCFVLILVLSLLLSGCKRVEQSERQNEVDSFVEYVTINGENISVDHLKDGIKNTFNNILYYHGDNETSPFIIGNKKLMINKEIEYELYFVPAKEADAVLDSDLPMVYFILTDFYYPASTEEEPLLYDFAIPINNFELSSDFYYMGGIKEGEKDDFFTKDSIYLGKHSLRIDEITVPEHEKMSEEWKNKAKEAIGLYMQENDFYSTKEENLLPGKYHVYIQGFSKSDEDSIIIFENENGCVYRGFYYFVHDVYYEGPADLNKVEIVEDEYSQGKAFQTYLSKVKANAALEMEYEVLTQGGE